MNEDIRNQTGTSSVQGASEGAAQAWEMTKERAGEALQTGERYIRENPGTSVLSVFGAGLLVGVLLGWTVAHQERDDDAEAVRKFLKRWGKKLNLE